MQKANVVLPATDPRGDGGKESGIQNKEKITEMRPNVTTAGTWSKGEGSVVTFDDRS